MGEKVLSSVYYIKVYIIIFDKIFRSVKIWFLVSFLSFLEFILFILRFVVVFL